ncbi:uncharacterized protein LOC102802550 [Saccoglossus kowalevskii]
MKISILPNKYEDYTDVDTPPQMNKITLTDWIICSNALTQTIYIEGHRSCDSKNNYWKSSSIVKRITNNIVATQSGRHYVLVGDINQELCLLQGFSKKFVRAFCYGFPGRWQSLVKSHFNLSNRLSDNNKKCVDVKPKTPTCNSKDRVNYQECQTPTSTVLDLEKLKTSSRGRRLKPPLAFWTGQRIVSTTECEIVAIIDGNPAVSPSRSRDNSFVKSKQTANKRLHAKTRDGRSRSVNSVVKVNDFEPARKRRKTLMVSDDDDDSKDRQQRSAVTVNQTSLSDIVNPQKKYNSRSKTKKVISSKLANSECEEDDPRQKQTSKVYPNCILTATTSKDNMPSEPNQCTRQYNRGVNKSQPYKQMNASRGKSKSSLYFNSSDLSEQSASNDVVSCLFGKNMYKRKNHLQPQVLLHDCHRSDNTCYDLSDDDQNARNIANELADKRLSWKQKDETTEDESVAEKDVTRSGTNVGDEKKHVSPRYPRRNIKSKSNESCNIEPVVSKRKRGKKKTRSKTNNNDHDSHEIWKPTARNHKKIEMEDNKKELKDDGNSTKKKAQTTVTRGNITNKKAQGNVTGDNCTNKKPQTNVTGGNCTNKKPQANVTGGNYTNKKLQANVTRENIANKTVQAHVTRGNTTNKEPQANETDGNSTKNKAHSTVTSITNKKAQATVTSGNITNKKVQAVVKAPVKIAGKGTMKRRKQLREIAKQHEEYEHDSDGYFEDDTKVLNLVHEYEDDIDAPLLHQTPALRMQSRFAPVSERKTPYVTNAYTPGFNTASRDKYDRIIHRFHKKKKTGQNLKARALLNKSPNEEPLAKSAKPNICSSVDSLAPGVFQVDYKPVSDSEEEQDVYFSDA